MNHEIRNVSKIRYLSYLYLDYTSDYAIDYLPDMTNNFILIAQ